MLGNSPVVAILPVSDLERAKNFYAETLGLKQEDENPAGITYQSGSSKLFIYTTQFAGTNKATAAGWMVEDIEGVVADLKSRGVTFEQYDDLPGTTRQGDIHILGPYKSAWFKDPDGNILNIATGM